jgi:hypothetical protein
MGITRISIRNFRSLQSVDLDAKDLNVFVGQNDEGKSNVLRALDLFFNGERRGGYNFEWTLDYCSATAKRKGKAEEIVITLEIAPPASFKNQQAVRWTKVWRRTGFYAEQLLHADGTKIGHTSKLAPFARSIRYDYVPAIKSGDYFQNLMGKLYDMLEATVEEEVRAASGTFTSTINSNTERILNEIMERLGLATTIELPKNLNLFFRQLEFTSTGATNAFSLNQRGDGIKVRHIPIVLRWLAERANYLSAPGKPKTVTIWGYEEPENNLELRRCFELAREFVETSNHIQTFITTHSPAFYSVFNGTPKEQVGLFHVSKDAASSVTSVKPIGEEDLAELDSAMGVMELLKPHFLAADKELNDLRKSLAGLTDTSRPTIFCEGPSDQKVIQECIALFFPEQKGKVEVRCSTSHGGGHRWVMESLIAWSFSRPTARAVGLFDVDPDAHTSSKEATDKINPVKSGRMAFCVSLSPNSVLIHCIKQKFRIPFAYEELLPEDVWTYAESRGWLEERNDPMGKYKFNQRSITFNDYVLKQLPENHLRRLALFKVKLENKESLAGYICGLKSEEDRKRVLNDLTPSIRECLIRLKVLTEAS